MEETWSIGELADRAADVLRVEAQPVNGRVRDVPSERLIRWYTTIGLVDPPLTRRGRIAQYGRRHLLQLVAIKRLQAQGRSIAEIQAALTGATDSILEAQAARRFWAERPAASAAETSEAPKELRAKTAKQSDAVVFGVRLAEGVTVMLHGASRTPSADDIEAVMAAAGPLLTVLEDRRLA